jgi:ADP-ribose pyrophosphatase YjhB (NUDIX family)
MWRTVHLCTGILERDGQILLVANRYPNLSADLWNLPGGRQEPPETLEATVIREFAEETALDVRVVRFAYLAESFDHATLTHFTNTAFVVAGEGEPQVPAGDRHVVGWAWVARAKLPRRLAVGVVREPLVGYLADSQRQYFGFADAGITIEFADGER